MKNAIGLNTEKSEKLVKELNNLLANYQVFYINTRGFHWNITGEKFFELHVKFEEIYNDALLKVDEIAERIRTLDQTPLHSFSSYLKHADIKEITGVTDGKKAMQAIVSGIRLLLDKQRVLLDLAKEINDEGTITMITDYIRQQEKQIWMYSAYLK
jgi:starvation-inducible DNA-binding protein